MPQDGRDREMEMEANQEDRRAHIPSARHKPGALPMRPCAAASCAHKLKVRGDPDSNLLVWHLLSTFSYCSLSSSFLWMFGGECASRWEVSYSIVLLAHARYGDLLNQAAGTAPLLCMHEDVWMR